MSSSCKFKAYTIACLFLSQAWSLSADDLLQKQVSKLLETGWEKGISSRNAALREYETLKPSAAIDVRVPYAMALIELKHHRYREAEELLSDANKVEAKHFGVNQSTLWIKMLRKEYSSALTGMKVWSKLLKDSPPEQQTKAAFFMGQLFGFLGGPVGRSVPPATVTEAKKAVSSSLCSEAQQALITAENQVIHQYQVITGKFQETKSQLKEEQQQDIERTQAELGEKKEEVSSNKSEIEETASSLESEANGRIGEIDSQLVPLNQEFARLNAIALPLQNRLGDLDRTIRRLRAAAAVEQDEFIRRDLIRDADRYAREYTRYDQEYAVLNAQATQVNAQRFQLAQQRDAVVAQYQQQMKSLGLKFKSLAKQEKKIDIQQKSQENKRPTGSNPQVRSMQLKASSFTTYVEFPMESEKENLLLSFQK